MKKCTWCGQEYPDAAGSCAVDGEPLEFIERAAAPEQSTQPLAANASGRPAAITVICCLGFMSGFLTLVTFFAYADTLRDLNPSYGAIMALNAIAVVASMFGLFKMRRWGLYAYTGLCVVNQILKLAMGGRWSDLDWIRIAAQGIILVIGFAYVRRMK